MSASQEKKNRAVLRNEGNDKKLNAAAESEKKNRKFRRNAIIAAIIVVIVIAGAVVVNSNLFYTGTTAVQIGDTKYSASEVNCYYQMAYNSVYNQYRQTYGDYVTYFLDPSKPLSEQQYTEDQTWADFIGEIAFENMKQTTALYDEAMKNGYQLSAEDSANIENNIESMRASAAGYGYENLNAFLASNYGKGVNETVFRNVLTKTTIAYAYDQQVETGRSYTDDELKSYYAAHKDELDVVAFYAYLVGTTDAAFADLDETAQISAAHDAAAEIAKAADADAFTAAVQAYAGEDAAVSINYAQGQSLDAAMGAWLMDSSRQAGDTTVLDIDGGSYAVLFVERDDNNYHLVNMRHILKQAEADENGEYSFEALSAAEAAAQSILTEWQADPTEDNFAALANQYSDDAGSNTTGGLYENVYRNNMVEEIDKFLFDSAAKPGDTTVVYGNNGSYAGYHVVYYIGEGPLFADFIADNLLRSDDQNKFLEDLTAPYSITTGFGMKFADFN